MKFVVNSKKSVEKKIIRCLSILQLKFGTHKMSFVVKLYTILFQRLKWVLWWMLQKVSAFVVSSDYRTNLTFDCIFFYNFDVVIFEISFINTDLNRYLETKSWKFTTKLTTIIYLDFFFKIPSIFSKLLKFSSTTIFFQQEPTIAHLLTIVDDLFRADCQISTQTTSTANFKFVASNRERATKNMSRKIPQNTIIHRIQNTSNKPEGKWTFLLITRN